SWLVPGFEKSNAARVPLAPQTVTNAARSFEPSSHFVPSWRGDSLPSKSSVVLGRAVNKLWLEAKRAFAAIACASKRRANMVHDEFRLCCACRELSLAGLESPMEFWRQMNDADSVHATEIANFRDIYWARAVTVYLFKIRSLIVLM